MKQFNLLSSRLALIFFTLISAFCLTSCDDDDQTRTYYLAYNSDNGGPVPYYDSTDEEAPAAGTLPSRTQCDLLSKGSLESAHNCEIAFEGDNGLDTAYISLANLFYIEREGTVTDVKYYGITTSETGGKVYVYDQADPRKAKRIMTLTEGVIVKDYGKLEGDMREVTFQDGTTGWVLNKSFYSSTYRQWEPKPAKLQQMRGKSEFTDKVIDWVQQQQDSDLHYQTSVLWLRIKAFIFLILFIIAFIYMAGGWEPAEEGKDWDITSIKFKWWASLLVAALGAMLIYYEYVDVVVMGDGYERVEPFMPWEGPDFGWFINLIIVIFGGLIYFITVFFLFLLLLLFQIFIPPMIGYAVCGNSWQSIVGNALMASVMFGGAAIALIAGADHWSTVFTISLCASILPVVYLVYAGLKQKYYTAALALLLPAAYIICIITIYFIAKYLIYVGGIIGIIFLCFGAAGTKASFQSQDSGRQWEARNQAGIPIETLSDEEKRRRENSGEL